MKMATFVQSNGVLRVSILNSGEIEISMDSVLNLSGELVDLDVILDRHSARELAELLSEAGEITVTVEKSPTSDFNEGT